MLPSKVFDLLDKIARKAKNEKYTPFGGIQIVVVGDFLQLPPIINKDASNYINGDEKKKFSFQSEVWKKAGLSDGGKVLLKEIMRQKDPIFTTILNEIRIGVLSSNSEKILNTCVVSVKPLPTDGITPTKLYCYRRDVDKENREKLEEIDEPEINSWRIDQWIDMPSSSAVQKSMIDRMNRDVSQCINLKVGAQVMLLRNELMRDGYDLANGSRGVVEGFTDENYPIVRFANDACDRLTIPPFAHEYLTDKGKIVRHQIPLKLAW